ncbi:hypothetical protein ACJRO7_013951 [Eucalyptus globulus]|uniref:Dolichyl-diphosphooligosaccharide-protein glycosyltransferase subunit OST5 n=1 Tax=Eucalyptus globulus TaxID=34317 RepID=A0ABD3KZG2_EUCGL
MVKSMNRPFNSILFDSHLNHRHPLFPISRIHFSVLRFVTFLLVVYTMQAPKGIASPVPISWYPTLSVLMLAIGLVITASFFIYEATSSRRNRSLAKELFTGAVASIFLGFGSLFLLLSCGIYV